MKPTRSLQLLGLCATLLFFASCSSSNRACKLCFEDDDCNAGYTCEEFTDGLYRCVKPGLDCDGIFPLAPVNPDSNYIVVDLNQDQIPDLVETSSRTWRAGTVGGGFENSLPLSNDLENVMRSATTESVPR